MMDEHDQELRRAGLCAICTHARVLRSDRGAVFYQCGRAETDPAYPKYPRLPVLTCRGFETLAPSAKGHLPTIRF